MIQAFRDRALPSRYVLGGSRARDPDPHVRHA